MSDCNPAPTPMSPKWTLEKFDGPQPNFLYTMMIGSLMWAALCTHPNIVFSVNHLVQFNSSFSVDHISAVKQVFWYLKGTLKFSIQFAPSDLGTKVLGFIDADWAEEKDQKSISGNLFIMSGGAVSWSVKKQGSIALSTLEAEYVVLCHASCHVLWHQTLIRELGFQHDQPFNLWNDNCGAIALTCDAQFHGHSKHIDIRHHFLHELVEHGKIKVHHICSEDNVVDIFTKPLVENLFKKFSLFLVKEL